jgi:FkbM family methyltransferase
MNLAATRLALLRRARRPGRIGALLAGGALKMMPQAAGDVNVTLWGRPLRLPANHHLPFIVHSNPFWSMPLVHCTAALGDSKLVVVDIGANIGDTACLLESELPGRCRFVCIEANQEWLPYLTANTAGLPVEIIRSFVGEGQHLASEATAPGSARSRVTDAGERSLPLDEICQNLQVDLIKVDTDGFDFPILRSGSRTLSSRRPALFFEWDPAAWLENRENPEEVFSWLDAHGYEDFCFFSDGGLFYCRTKQPETIRSLIAAADARRGIDAVYWDVFAASREVCDRAVSLNIKAAQQLAAKIPLWNRLQPTYWQ